MAEGEQLGLSVEQADSFAVMHGFAVIKLTGRLVDASIGVFEASWERMLAGGIQGVAVDMADLEFVSSAGLRSLHKLGKALASPRSGLVLFGMRAALAKVFKYSGFERMIPVVGTREEALKRLRVRKGGEVGGTM